jgi:hypothetical protein
LAIPRTSLRAYSKRARDHVRQNKIDAEQFGHLPTPAGANKIFHWEDDGEGHWTRQFEGTRCGFGLANKGKFANRVDVCIDGLQHGDGTIERSIFVYSSGAEMTSADARQLATTLTEAADELDRLKLAQGGHSNEA